MSIGEDYGLIWVCQCCLLVAANGECCEDDSHGGDGIEPLSLVTDGYSVTCGMGYEDHAEGCENRSAVHSWSDRVECDCETKTFSRSQCQGCGSRLHGERHAMHLWKG